MDRPKILDKRKPKTRSRVNLRKKRSPAKFKKTLVPKNKSKKTGSKKSHDLRLPYDICISMGVRDIRKTQEYKLLTPLGKKNTSGKYKYGNKSYMNKEELCRALDNPEKYHTQIAVKKSRKVNAGPRKRATRKGECPGNRNLENCSNHPTHKHAGLTTSGNHCCYKKKQSKKVLKKRGGN